MPPQGHAEAASDVATGQQPGHARGSTAADHGASRRGAGSATHVSMNRPPQIRRAPRKLLPRKEPGTRCRRRPPRPAKRSRLRPRHRPARPTPLPAREPGPIWRLGLALLVLVLAGAVAYLARKRKAG
ncbi:MAG: hypothetical protein MZW92_75525 [Comamonadaceae bacterium]|nr:hypothetical protein [Comamonadaceae bacterium]